MEKVRLRLAGLDGNAFYLLGAFREAARKQGWRADEIKRVCYEATSGDYDHLLVTLSEHTADPDEWVDE